jgi:hypothetical protein
LFKWIKRKRIEKEKREREREREKQSPFVKWIKELKFWFSLVQKGNSSFPLWQIRNNVYQQQPHSNRSSEIVNKSKFII